MTINRKNIIKNWSIDKNSLFSCYKDFNFRNGYKGGPSSTHLARNRKKLVKIVLNGKTVWYHFFDKLNKTLYIESNSDDLVLYSDQ